MWAMIAKLRIWGQDDAEAQNSLGGLYYKGHGVPQDYAEARKWYRKASQQGLPKAQYNLGGMYYNGYGVPQDYAEAGRWYSKAAKQGDAEAQFSLGIMYYWGQSVPQDYVQAHLGFILAASRLPPGKDRDKAVEARDIVAKDMTPAQIAEAQQLAREWRTKHGYR